MKDLEVNNPISRRQFISDVPFHRKAGRGHGYLH